MEVQEQIDHVKGALAAVNSAITQTQAALHSASTVEDMQALQNTLIDLQAERSQLEANLIALQAAQTQVQPFNPELRTPTSKGILNLSEEQVSEVGTLQSSLKASVVDRTVTEATLKHAAKVAQNAGRLRSLLNSASETGRK